MNTLTVLILCSFCTAVGGLIGWALAKYEPRIRPEEQPEPMAWRRGSGW